MASLGTIALALALGACLMTVGAGALGGWSGRMRFVALSRNGLHVVFGLIGLAAAALLFAFVEHDFSIKYVEGRSDTRMPMHYVLSAFYGGQEGSLLFWVLVSSGFASAAAALNRHRRPRLMTWFHAMAALGLMGFLLILNFVTPPFEAWFVIDAPADGSGLNPLLQTPLMTIHPPMLLSGFATALVPFAFGMAALCAGQVDSEWLRATRRWTLASWLILGVGNILGGMWAYRELGWGGYWAWDAVENAALVPWLVATAFVHSVIIQEQRGMLKRWNVVLVASYYLLTLLGTWMTRSGLIDSVHTFAESDIGVFFLVNFLAMTLLAAVLIARRWKDLAPEASMEDPLSREGMFVFNNWLFVGMAAVVLYGTLYPKFSEMLFGAMITYGPPFFNRAMAPLGLIMLALMALGTIMPWRRASGRHFAQRALWPTVITIVGTPALIALYWFTRGQELGVRPEGSSFVLTVVCFALIVLNAVVLVDEFVRGARVQMRGENRNPFTALQALFAKFRRRYGGYIAHLGVLMIFFAFLGNALKVERDVTLAPGDIVDLADFELSYHGIEVDRRDDYLSSTAALTLTRDGTEIARLTPARYDYNDYTRLGPNAAGDPMSITSEIYIRSTPLEDVYVTMLNFDAESEHAAFKIEVFPFTMWMWLGGLFLILGVAIAAWPDEDPLTRRYRYQVAARRGVNAYLALVFLAPVAVLATPEWSMAQVAQHDDHEGHDHGDDGEAVVAGSGRTVGALASVDLSPEQEREVLNIASMVMTTCSGCAGKTLTLASPGCVPTNADKRLIRQMVASGLSRDEVLDAFVRERGETAVAIPRDTGQKRLALMAPIAFLAAGLLFVLWFVRRKGNAGTTSETASAEDAWAPDDDDPWMQAVRQDVRDLEGSR